MKPTTLIATLILASVVGMAQAAPAAAPMQPGPAASLSGEVLEVRNVDAYSYLRLKTASGEIWAAVPTAMVAKGAKVTIERPMMMENFESKTLKKTFDRIAFGTIAGAAAPAALGPGAQNGGMSPHGMGAAAGPVPAAAPMKVVKVSKASGPDGKTVAEVVSGKAFEDAVRDLVFTPLGLSNTTFWPWEAMLKRFGVGHMAGFGNPPEPKVASPWPIGRATHGAGGINSTVNDLIRYALLHLLQLEACQAMALTAERVR